MASESPLGPTVAERDITVGVSGKSSPVRAVAGGGDEIYNKEQKPPPCAGDEPNDENPCVGAEMSSDGSNGHSSVDSAVAEIHNPNLPPQDPNEPPIDPVLETTEEMRARMLLLAITESPIHLDSLGIIDASHPERIRAPGIGNWEEGRGIGFTSLPNVSMGCTAVPPPVNERGLAIGFTSLPNIRSGTLVLPVYGEGEGGRIHRLLPGIASGGTYVFQPFNAEGGHMLARIDIASLISMGGTLVIQTGNVVGGHIRPLLESIGLASPSSTGDTLVIQTGDVEAGHLLTGRRFGVGRSDINPTSHEFQMYIGNGEPQTGNNRPPLEISGDNSHLVRPLEQNCFVVLLVTSEILGIVFEIIYQESHTMAYFFIWIVCGSIAIYAARLLAMIEGGMANREQFAVYLRCFSFLLLELLQYWGIHQGNYVTALKIILRVTGAVIGWWVVGVLQAYMGAFGMHLPLRRRDD